MSGDSGYVKDGRGTAEGIAALRKKMPHADIDAFAADPRVENFQNVYTVQMVVNFLDRKLNDSADRRAA
jgi:hypothetical protein